MHVGSLYTMKLNTIYIIYTNKLTEVNNVKKSKVISFFLRNTIVISK